MRVEEMEQVQELLLQLGFVEVKLQEILLKQKYGMAHHGQNQVT